MERLLLLFPWVCETNKLCKFRDLNLQHSHTHSPAIDRNTQTLLCVQTFFFFISQLWIFHSSFSLHHTHLFCHSLCTKAYTRSHTELHLWLGHSETFIINKQNQLLLTDWWHDLVTTQRRGSVKVVCFQNARKTTLS